MYRTNTYSGSVEHKTRNPRSVLLSSDRGRNCSVTIWKGRLRRHAALRGVAVTYRTAYVEPLFNPAGSSPISLRTMHAYCVGATHIIPAYCLYVPCARARARVCVCVCVCVCVRARARMCSCSLSSWIFRYIARSDGVVIVSTRVVVVWVPVCG